jgi:hypothetical protein
MKILLASVAALGLLAGSANAANLVIGFGTGAQGGSEAQATSNAGAGTVTGPIFGFAATQQSNVSGAAAGTTATGTTTLGGSTVNGASVAGTSSTSTGAGFSLGLGASVGGSGGSAGAGAGSTAFGFSGLGVNLP